MSSKVVNFEWKKWEFWQKSNPNQSEPNQSEPNQSKLNQSKPNQSKSNQSKPNQSNWNFLKSPWAPWSYFWAWKGGGSFMRVAAVLSCGRYRIFPCVSMSWVPGGAALVKLHKAKAALPGSTLCQSIWAKNMMPHAGEIFLARVRTNASHI